MSGTAVLWLEGNMLTVRIEASGLEAGMIKTLSGGTLYVSMDKDAGSGSGMSRQENQWLPYPVYIRAWG